MMGYKAVIKQAIGIDNTRRLKWIIQSTKSIRDTMLKRPGIIETRYNYRIYQLEEKHVFFGYYDLQQVSHDQKYLLAHVVDNQSVPGRDFASIVVINRQTGAFQEITRTKAWCWQQGSRLRWHPQNDDWIVFNSSNDNNYTSEVWDYKAKELIKTFPLAFYDISRDGEYGLSLNFSRLQCLRPGYGYSCIEDDHRNDYAPEGDGIWKYSFIDNSCRLIVELSELRRLCNASDKDYHYINHVSISPDGSRFIFFHLWTKGQGLTWKNKLYLFNNEKNELICLEDRETVSHYCWISNKELLVTTIEGKYYRYSLANESVYKTPALNGIERDGHPTSCGMGDTVLSDTYPQGDGYQYLYMVNSDGEKYNEIAKIYCDPMLFDDCRCDLHPRFNDKDNSITVDTSFMKKKRSVIEIELGG